MEKCNLQVASIHQIEEGNEKELCAQNLEQIKNVHMTVGQTWVTRLMEYK